ncbi:MAG: GNAT family N-acetyltransferase [Clostridiales bacterium]|nr:GNAT family N-acetyltransferase [Clostridiales bacterium]
MKHLGTAELNTPRLILRKFRLEDADAMYRNWASDGEVTRYLTWPSHESPAASRSVLKNWVDQYQDPGCYQWAIVLRDSPDEPIGSISVTNTIDETIQSAHIGYCIGREWWHRGITSEALGRIIAFLFDEVGLRRIEARHDPRNPHSGQVMQKCGLQYEGTLRQADWNNQGICDACYYGLLAADR